MLYLTYDTWHRYLPCYIWPMIPNTGTLHIILHIWFMTPAHGIYTDTWYVIFATWSTTLDIRHRYLPCYTYHLISDTGTCHASLDTWHSATWYQYTWPDIVTPDWILLHRTPYFFAYSWLSLLRGLDYYTGTRHLVLLNSCTPELLYSWTPEKGWLLILYSYWSL